MSEVVIMPKAHYEAACNAIRSKTGKEDVIKSGDMEAEILGITTSGGSSEDVCYVTFMSEDGSEVYGIKPVAVGDDCADPIARGLFDTPTKESTAQYSYTHYGWSLAANGATNADALKSVTEDRTVYATFASAVRYYTISYYDSDGTTLLTTESVAYGSMPSYVPTNGEYDFGGWTPEATAVVGDASYTVIWKEKATFETATWKTIAEICNAGKAAEYFSVGDKKPVTFSYADGTSETINFTIVDMGVNKKTDGTMAALTIMADNQVKNSLQPASGASSTSEIFTVNDNAKTFFEDLLAAMPEDLQEVIATVHVYLDISMLKVQDSKIFIPTQKQLTDKVTYNSSFGDRDVYKIPYAQFAYFAAGASIRRTKLADETSDDYWTATTFNKLSGHYYIYVDGDSASGSSNGIFNNKHGIVPCFCI